MRTATEGRTIEEYGVRAHTIGNRSIVGRTIAEMAVGESAYVPPTALFLMRDRACHIQTDMPARDTLDDENSVHVTRTVQGYVADITYCTCRWEAHDRPTVAPHAPVVHVVFGDEFLR